MGDIQEKYQKLVKQHRLPRYEDLDGEFEIRNLDDDAFLLNEILRRFIERLEFYAGILNDLMQPEASSMSSMHETRFFTDSEKNEMYGLFKRIMKAQRSALEHLVKHDEARQAVFVSTFFDGWKGMKGEILGIISKIKDSWDKETTIEEDVGYFG
jgi:hypothetical protein